MVYAQLGIQHSPRDSVPRGFWKSVASDRLHWLQEGARRMAQDIDMLKHQSHVRLPCFECFHIVLKITDRSGRLMQ